MVIKPMKVERDARGYWTHSEVPDLVENQSLDYYAQWFLARGVVLKLVCAEEDCDEALLDDFDFIFNGNLSEWNPSPPCAEAFLLSIHDTEAGPVSWWGVQSEQLSPCHVQ